MIDQLQIDFDKLNKSLNISEKDLKIKKKYWKIWKINKKNWT